MSVKGLFNTVDEYICRPSGNKELNLQNMKDFISFFFRRGDYMHHYMCAYNGGNKWLYLF